MRRSLGLSLTAVFAALHSVLYFVPIGLGWRNWGIYLAPLEGIILGPKWGFLAAFVGSSVARIARPDDFWMFGIFAESLSALMVGLLARAKWKPVMTVYMLMLSAYFVHPFGRALPVWTILDILLAPFLIYPTARYSDRLFKTNVRGSALVLASISFVCIVTDSLARVFLLVPCGLYNLFFIRFDILQDVFVGAAALSYYEDILVIFVSLLVALPILLSILKLKILEIGHDP